MASAGLSPLHQRLMTLRVNHGKQLRVQSNADGSAAGLFMGDEQVLTADEMKQAEAEAGDSVKTMLHYLVIPDSPEREAVMYRQDLAAETDFEIHTGPTGSATVVIFLGTYPGGCVNRSS